ncbi:MAG: site-specific DNA-methyltransferase [Anaerolineae bacterium]|nr:site-specific DNA-methyltransferase [Anaerolineae bacterium]
MACDHDAPLPLDTILPGDCIEVLQSLPPACADLVFADPPYNLQLRGELFRPNRTRVNGVADAWDHFDSFETYDEFTRAWLQGCRRAMKPDATLWVIGTYHNIFRIGKIMQDLGFWILNDIIWVKTNPMPNFRGVRFTNAHETLIWASRQEGARYTFNHQDMKGLNDDLQMRSDWLLPLCRGAERLKVNGEKAHPTQKPEALLYRILLASSSPGGVVLDPFFGSGTTGAVAKRLGRHYIGIERNTGYIDLAQRRIATVEPVHLTAGDWQPPAAPRRARRLPFGALVENSLLDAGDSLYFAGDLARPAIIQPDARLRLADGFIGTIHQAALREHGREPCNGWTLWYYRDAAGVLRPIDALRQHLRDSEEAT